MGARLGEAENVASNEHLTNKSQNGLLENDPLSLTILGIENSTNTFSPSHSNLISHPKFQNIPDVQMMEKMNSNQCVKNGFKSFQCSLNKDMKSESESEVKDSNLNKSDSAVKTYHQPFSTDKKSQLSVPFDVSCRKSPIHGKAPRNSPFRETKGFQKLDSLGSSAGENLETGGNINLKSELTPTEPSNISKFHPKTSQLNDKCESSYPSDDKDCAKVIDQDSSFFFNSKSDNLVRTLSYSDDFTTKKSEDTRNLTQKRCSEKILRSRLKPVKKPISKAKTKKGKNSGLPNRCNARLTRSQIKDAAAAPIVGAGDDDSGIQGDIYEFSEKESNLEDISLPNRVPHLRDKYHMNQDVFHHGKEIRLKENSLDSEENHNE